jgi:hypothetical protein
MIAFMEGQAAEDEVTRGPRLVEILPQFASEIERALAQDDRVDLAEQVQTLRVMNLCGCDDAFCSSFYVGPGPRFGKWKDEGDYQNILVDVRAGMVILDVVDRIIRYVEVIDRPEVSEALERGFS